MADSEVTIWNRALTTAGHRGAISAPLENSREADLCRLWYDSIRTSILKAATWPCATAYSRLALIEERVDGTDWTEGAMAPGWRYAYAMPSDLLAPRYLMNFARFTRGVWGEQLLLHCNEITPVLHYTKDQPSVQLWDTGLSNAVTAALAAKITQALNGKAGLADKLRNEAIEIIMSARTDMANESEELFDELPSWIQARGYTGGASTQRFLWPYQDLSGVPF